MVRYGCLGGHRGSPSILFLSPALFRKEHGDIMARSEHSKDLESLSDCARQED